MKKLMAIFEKSSAIDVWHGGNYVLDDFSESFPPRIIIPAKNRIENFWLFRDWKSPQKTLCNQN